jgi:ABC-type multidrug transport system ATPase subunit
VKPEENRPLNREIIAMMRDVTMTYDGYQTRALTRVNLDFRRGEVVGVLGAKGAGKSTVLKILAGRLRATEGSVKVFGRSPRGSAKARVGYLAGNDNSGRPAGFLSRFFKGKKEAASPGRGVGRLAQAALGNRDLLVLDDPFDGLDEAARAEARTMIQDMIARGKTVVLSSESLMDVKELCERFIILHEGKVQAAGTLVELLSAGGAIRFLPAILPREIVGRVLDVLREQIIGGPVLPQTAASLSEVKESIAATAPEKQASTVPSSDQLLTSLTKPTEGALPPSAPTTSKPEDPIDHGKLEELTKLKP